jgi:hypothetical protein
MKTARSISIIIVGNNGTNQLTNKISLSLLAHGEKGHGHSNNFFKNDSRKCLVEKEQISKGINKHCKNELV